MTDSQEPARENINKVTASQKQAYLDLLTKGGKFTQKSFLPVSDACHFERYNYTCAQGKLGVVYDTKAEMLTFTAKAPVLKAAFAAIGYKANETVPESPVREVVSSVEPQATKKALTKRKKAVAQAQSAQQNTAQAQPVQQNAPNVPCAAQELKDGFSIKKCPPQRLEGFVARIRALKGITLSSDAAQNKDIVTYTVTDKARKEKCLLRYAPKKQSVQLQGKRSNLFAQVQVILSSNSAFGEAMGSHVKLTGEQKNASAVQRSLKKLLPDAFDLLSEQSKIDLGIGMVDIGNKGVRLSDYSVLLVPPYRGLERFIYDLQQAQSISVKMIGQAYEKDDAGHYRLKLGYRKKTGVVYAEVMSALYTEYFEKRNFYAHSDNSELGYSRVIAEKDVANTIFTHLCEVINYNAKKLKETGFKL